MIPWFAFFLALSVVLVLAQLLRHSGDREARSYRQLVQEFRQDRDAAREEANALRIAIFPALARLSPKQPAAEVAPKNEPEPEKPLSLNERIRAIWLNRRMSTRQKMSEITRLSNSKQARRDSINGMAAQAEENSQQVPSAHSTEEKPA